MKSELDLIIDVTRKNDVISKVIIETCYLSKEEKVIACKLVKESGADFVKTSTGFGKGGATADDVKLLRELVGRKIGVKASGGIRTYEDTVNMIRAGATRIGSSAGVAIIEARARVAPPC